MRRLGYRTLVVGARNLTPLRKLNTIFPEVPEGHYVVCGIGPEDECELFRCEGSPDIIECYKAAGRRQVTLFSGHGFIGEIAS